MQYTQRKLHRSVTEIRRSRSGRPKASVSLILFTAIQSETTPPNGAVHPTRAEAARNGGGSGVLRVARSRQVDDPPDGVLRVEPIAAPDFDVAQHDFQADLVVEAGRARSQETELDGALEVGATIGPLEGVDASGKSPG